MRNRVGTSMTVVLAIVIALMFQAGSAQAALTSDTEGTPPSDGDLTTASAPAVLNDISDALNEEAAAPAVSEFVDGLVDTALPDSGDAPATSSGPEGSLTMAVPAEGTDVAVQSDNTALFDGTADDTTLAVQSTSDGLRALVHIDSADAPERFEFPIGGDVVSLTPREDGGVDAVNAAGEVIAAASAPWATDANGADVPTHYEIVGTTLVQVVEHRDAGFAYGIVADPSWHWWGVEFKLSHDQAQKLIWALGATTSATGLTAAVCAGTIAGAIPCGVGYAIFAAINGLSAATLTYCDRRSKGIYLRYHWFGAFVTCGTR